MNGSSFEQTWILFTQGCFVPSLVEIGSVVLEKKILKFCQCIFAISQLSPLGKGRGPSFEQTWILITQEGIVPSLVEIGPEVLEKKDFWILSMYFRYFVIISLLKKAWPFIWTNLNSLYHMMLCDKFGWYWHCGSGDWRFLYFVNAFSLIRNYLPLEMGLALHLIKFESSLPKLKTFCAKFGWNCTSGSGEEFFLNFDNIFLLFRNCLPLELGVALYLNKFESFFFFCQVWLKLVQWFWKRRWRCEKFTDGWRTTSDQQSSLELSSQLNNNNFSRQYKQNKHLHIIYHTYFCRIA